MQALSFNNPKEQYHREHKDYDFVKFQKGELVVKHREGEVYVCNQTCVADWLFLMQTFSPVFTKIVVVEKSNGERKAGLRILGPIESILAAIGLDLPEVVQKEKSYIYFNVKKLKEEAGFLWYKGQRPVVIFPEGTKTNGLGILNIEPNIIKMINDAGGIDQNLRCHGVRFDHKFAYFAAYNSTDSWGLKSVINLTCQFTSCHIIQYYFNMEGVLHDCVEADKHEFVKRCLMIRRKEQSMKNLDWRDHQEFLSYWNDTYNKGTYSSKKTK